MSNRRPSIFQIGRVEDNGEAVIISGWGLGQCQSSCSCHCVGPNKTLAIQESPALGTIGLVSNRPECTCCEPWHATELTQILSYLTSLNDISTGPEKDSQT